MEAGSGKGKERFMAFSFVIRLNMETWRKYLGIDVQPAS
jgi:hypothetical protein